MNRLSRRQFLGKALLAGAGTVLTYPLALGDFGPAQANAQTSPPDIDPGFLAGQVIAIPSPGLLTIQDFDSLIRSTRLTATSRTWKAARWNTDPIAVGDCVYVRGDLDATGVLQVERFWANIASFPAEVTGVSPTDIPLLLEDGTQTLG